jgi:hypothetical protein
MKGFYSKPAKRISEQIHHPKTRHFPWQSFLINCLSFLAIVSAGGIVGAMLWVGFWMVIDPDYLLWVNRYLPASHQIPPVQKNPPQTLTQIKNDLAKVNLQMGEIINFGNHLLVPILRPACQGSCLKIIELRLYQPLSEQPQLYHLKRLLPVEDVEESLVLAPLVKAGVREPVATNRLLPLTKITVDTTAPKSGVWLHLTGQTGILYGRVVHYNPRNGYLSFMAVWSSPNNKMVSWRQENGQPELVVDRSVGLEPSFQIYQLQSRDFVPSPLWLVETQLNQPAIDDQGFHNAIILAKAGLWSDAAKQIQALRQSAQWSPLAESQYALIQLHAQAATAQTKASWSSPSQILLAQIVDGAWAESLKTLESIDNPLHMQEVVNLLNQDRGRLWGRVQASLQINPNHPEARIWGALIIGIQHNRAGAIAWLQNPAQFRAKSSNLLITANSNPQILNRLSYYANLLDMGRTGTN